MSGTETTVGREGFLIEPTTGGVNREIDWIDDGPCWDRPLPPGLGDLSFKPLYQGIVK